MPRQNELPVIDADAHVKVALWHELAGDSALLHVGYIIRVMQV